MTPVIDYNKPILLIERVANGDDLVKISVVDFTLLLPGQPGQNSHD